MEQMKASENLALNVLFLSQDSMAIQLPSRGSVHRSSMNVLNLMNKELKQIGIYKFSGKSLSPLQSQVHQLLDLKDNKLVQSMRFENQNIASSIFLLNLD